MIYTIASLVGRADCQGGPDSKGRWSRSIPLPFYGGYLSAAWAVLRGRAVAVRYPVCGELEQALADSGGIHVSGRYIIDEHADVTHATDSAFYRQLDAHFSAGQLSRLQD